MMRRAAQAALAFVEQTFPRSIRLLVFCGGGNNGGDGWLLAALALQKGYAVRVVALAPSDKMAATATKARAYATECGVSCTVLGELPVPAHSAESDDLVVDALLGTGLTRPPGGAYLAAISWINSAPLPVLSLDVPSGLNADSGAIMEAAVRSDFTISFVSQKRGLLTGAGRDYSGARYFDDLSLPQALYDDIPPCRSIRPATIKGRRSHAHKGSYGHVLVVGGNRGMTGAAVLAATAALRVGAGLVSVASADAAAFTPATAHPELMVHGVRSAPELGTLLARATVVVLGPGLGRDAWARQMLYAVSRSSLPLVLDADGLRLLAQDPDMKIESCYKVMTPHPGEASALMPGSVAEVEDNRFDAARRLCEKYRATVVLKGAGTIVCSQPEYFAVCDKGSAAMASGGMGDVLSGVLGGLLAQEDIYAERGNDARPARVELGVYLHSWAADSVLEHTGERGMLASDLWEHLPRLLKKMHSAHHFGSR